MRGVPGVSTRSFAFVSARLLPWVLLIGMLISGCGGAECEQLRQLTGPDGRPIYELTCIHECGMVLTMGWQLPAPSCEWQHSVCVARCADGPTSR